MGFWDKITYNGLEFSSYSEPFEYRQDELASAGLVTPVVDEWQEKVPAEEYDWPPAEELSTRYADGVFANDIRKRFGVDSDEPVLITERRYEDGYSEYTNEVCYDIKIECAGHVKEFYDSGLKDIIKWIEGEE